MRRKRGWWLGLGLLAALLVGVGWSVYRTHHEVQVLGQTVYKELDGDGLPPPPDLLEDRAFRTLPPAEGPVSLGRYKVPAVTPATPAPTPEAPTPAAQTPAGQTPGAQTPAIPGATYAPTTFTERVRSGVRLHILLIATDQETLGTGRGDVLMVLTFDPKARQLSLLSVPRDTRVTLPEHGTVKINAAYAYGGAVLQTQAIERFLGIPMDKYVEISLGGFRQAIDRLGGVKVDPPFAFSLDGQAFRPGETHLNGEQALAYARMRKDDPQGDLGRNARQQEVIRNLMGQVGQLSGTELNALVGQLSTYLRTNFSPSEVVRLRAEHSYLFGRQRTVNVRGMNRRQGGAWFYVVSDAERRRLNLLLR